MQRMELHLSGVKVPKLGSLHDRVYREYMTKKSQLEVERTKFHMFNALTNPTIGDAGKAREWSEKIKRIWSNYLALEYGVEVPEYAEREIQMREYYENVVKHLKPVLQKTEKGYNVKGLDVLRQ
jgi:hypothetical protein